MVVVAPVSQWWWSVSPRVFLAKIPFLAFSRYHGNLFAKFLTHVLSWVKTYQRNPPTGSAGMMVETYRQTGWVSSIPKSLVKI